MQRFAGRKKTRPSSCCALDERISSLAAETRSTADLLRAHARLLSGWLRKSGFRDGCPVTTVLLELSPRDRGVAEFRQKAYAARIDILKRKLTSDDFSQANTGPLAILCVSALQGALIQARVERSGAPIETAAEQLAKMLEAIPTD